MRMNFERKTVKIGDIVMGRWNENERKAMNNKLLVQPDYQRNFLYEKEQQIAVVESVFKNCLRDVVTFYELPANEAKEKGYKYECIDGQQRITSLCKFVANEFSVRTEDDLPPVQFKNLEPEELDWFNKYPLQVDILKGSKGNVISFFKRKNTFTGVPLTDIELLLGVYNNAFTKTCKAYMGIENKEALMGNLFKGFMPNTKDDDFNRYKTLEIALKWFADNQGFSKVQELFEHATFDDFKPFKRYLRNVFDWVEDNFSFLKKYDTAKRPDWGILYNNYGEKDIDVNEAEELYKNMLADDEVTNKKGIVDYLVSEKLCVLNIRAFTRDQIAAKLAEQGFVDGWTGEPLTMDDAVGDHKTPWSEGGRTTYDNLIVCSARTNAHRSDSGKMTRYC